MHITGKHDVKFHVKLFYCIVSYRIVLDDDTNCLHLFVFFFRVLFNTKTAVGSSYCLEVVPHGSIE